MKKADVHDNDVRQLFLDKLKQGRTAYIRPCYRIYHSFVFILALERANTTENSAAAKSSSIPR